MILRLEIRTAQYWPCYNISNEENYGCFNKPIFLLHAKAASASLLGDTILLMFASPSASDVVPGGLATRTVSAGNTDIWDFTTSTGLHFSVNPENYGILITFSDGYLGDNPFEGLVISGLDTPLVHVTIDTNLNDINPVDPNGNYWNDSRLSFHPSGMQFNWQNLNFSSNTYFYAQLQFASLPHSTTPEPLSLALVGSGLFAAALLKRQRQK